MKLCGNKKTQLDFNQIKRKKEDAVGCVYLETRQCLLKHGAKLEADSVRSYLISPIK